MAPTDVDGLDGAPWYVKVLIRVGVPTALASVLLWFLITNVTDTLKDMSGAQVQLNKSDAIIVGNQERIINLLAQQADDQRRNAAVLSALCYNLSDTIADRERCAMALTSGR